MIRHASSLAAILLLLSSSCAPVAHRGSGGTRYFGSTTPPTHDILRFELSADPETVDPGLATGQPDGRACRALFEGLTREDAHTLEPLPGQAYRWDISPDGLTYTFHLRPGLTWSDGTPITAEDFRWSWLRVLKPETASRNAGLLSPILNADSLFHGGLKDERQVGIAAPDDSTFVVTLQSPTPYFLSLTSYNTFMPVPRRVVERFGEVWARPGHLIGNGAFTLRSWRQNDAIVFDKNPRYWEADSVRLEGLVGYTADAIGIAANLYKAGMVDWNPSGNIPSPFLPYMRDFADYHQGRYQGIYFYSINTTKKPYDNVWVRRALNWSVDRHAITDDLLKGTRDAWGNFTPSGYPGYHAPDPVRFDPAYARECLAKAGYPGGRGFPRLEILFNTSEDHRRIAEAIQAMWKRELGISVELANQDFASYLKTTTGLEYQVARRSWLGDYLDPNSFLASYRTGDGNNRTGWSNPRYDALIRDAASESDGPKRMALLREAETLLLDESPVIPIYHYTTTELVKPYVHGLYTTPLDVHPLTHVWIDRNWRADAPGAHAETDAREVAQGQAGTREDARARADTREVTR